MLDRIEQEKQMEISNDRRIRLERAIVRALIEHMNDKGWVVSNVFNGEEHKYPGTFSQAVNSVFEVDEASLRFIRGDKLSAYDKEFKIVKRPAVREAVSGNIGGDWSDTISEHGVLLVLGNGEDVVSDWNYSDGDPDGFNAAMDEFDVEKVRA